MTIFKIKEIASSKTILLGIFIVLSFSLYAPILNGYFVAEDLRHITFTWDEVKAEFSGEGQSIGFRPGSTLYLVICNHLWGRNPVGHHFFAILFHAIVVWFIHQISFELTNNDIAALLSSIIFLNSPVNVESVAWLAASAGQLTVAVLCMLSIWLWIREIPQGKLTIGIVTMLYLTALFIKEIAIPLPGLLLLLDWFRKNSICFRNYKELIPYAPLAGAFFFYLAFYINAGVLQSSFGYGGMSGSIIILIVKIFVDLSFYIRDLFQPVSYALQPILGLGAGNFFYLVIFVLLFLFKKDMKWALYWFLIALLPTIFSYAERLNYLAIIGFYISASYIFISKAQSLINNTKQKFLWLILIGIPGILIVANVVLVRQEINSWLDAGNFTKNIPLQAKVLQPELPPGAKLYFVGLPDNVKGAYAYRWGIDHEIRHVYMDQSIAAHNVSRTDAKWGQIDLEDISCEEIEQSFFFEFNKEKNILSLVDEHRFGVVCP